MESNPRFAQLLTRFYDEILGEWSRDQLTAPSVRKELMKENELHDQCRAVLAALREGAQEGDLRSPQAPPWTRLREAVKDIARVRGRQGFTSPEIASFFLSLKKPVWSRLRGRESEEGFEDLCATSNFFDKLGLYAIEVHQKSREDVINRQQDEMIELSTPVVKLWEGILALPMIGTLDSRRSQVMMETLLQKIVETNAEVAIIDITGVPTVDTLVAQLILKTIAAARLMGADCIISGIRPQIAQTIVHLAIDLGQIQTKANLSDAFGLALQRQRLKVAPMAMTADH